MSAWKEIIIVQRMLDVKKCQEAIPVLVTLDMREMERYAQVR